MTSSTAIFEPVANPVAARREPERSATDDFRSWFDSLSLLDQQLLRQHARDGVPPQRILDLFRYAPVNDDAWSGAGEPRSYYPQPLLQVLSAR